MRIFVPGRPASGRVAALTAAAALVASPAFAAEGGLPQLRFADYPAQIVWLVICFLVLYALLKLAVLPRLTGTIESRATRITGDLDAAAKAKADAEAAVAGYEKALAEARDRANSVAAEQRAAVQAEIDARKAEVEAKIAEETKAAEARIHATKDAAMAEVRGIAALAARDIAAKIAGLEVDEMAAGEAVGRVLNRSS